MRDTAPLTKARLILATPLLLLLALGARPTHADDGTLTWPLPWKMGTTLSYDKSTVTSKQARGVEKVRRYTDVTQISIVRAGSDGYLQRWSSRDVAIDNPGAAPAEVAAEREAVQRMSMLPIDVQLDGQGLFTRIGNLSTLQPVYRSIVAQGMERSLAQSVAAIADAQAREQALAKARAGNAPALERATSEAALNNLMAPQPLSYNYFAVGGMVAGQRYEIEDMGESLLGEPLPMLATVRVVVDPADPRYVVGQWTLAPHPQKAAPLLWANLETLTRAPIPAAQKQGLPSQLDVRTELMVRIERATGIVQSLRRIETRLVLDNREVKTTIMQLRP